MFNEINYLVDHASQTVSFNNQTVTANIGDTITITDTNGMLSSFFDVSANGLAVTKNGNTLTIKSNSAYNGNITLTPKTGNKPIIYDGATAPVWGDTYNKLEINGIKRKQSSPGPRFDTKNFVKTRNK